MLGLLSNRFLTTPLFPLVLLGCAYALILTFIPCIPLVVHKKYLGTAYGLSNSFANLSWALFPILVAALVSHDPTFVSTELFFAFCAMLAMGVSVIILRLDRFVHHHVLHRPSPKSLSKEHRTSSLSSTLSLSNSMEVMEEGRDDVALHLLRAHSPRLSSRASNKPKDQEEDDDENENENEKNHGEDEE